MDALTVLLDSTGGFEAGSHGGSRRLPGCPSHHRIAAKLPGHSISGFRLHAVRADGWLAASASRTQQPSLLPSRLAKGATKVPRPCRVMIRPRSRNSVMECRSVW